MFFAADDALYDENTINNFIKGETFYETDYSNGSILERVIYLLTKHASTLNRS